MTRTILAAAAAALIAAAAPAVAGDAAAGEKVFKKCAACHAVGAGAKNKVGPVLTGVVGRNVASVEGFKYSDPMKAHGGAQEARGDRGRHRLSQDSELRGRRGARAVRAPRASP